MIENEILGIIKDQPLVCRVVEIEDDLYGVYVFENSVYVIYDSFDWVFISFAVETQKKIVEKLKKGEFVLNDSFCG